MTSLVQPFFRYTLRGKADTSQVLSKRDMAFSQRVVTMFALTVCHSNFPCGSFSFSLRSRWKNCSQSDFSHSFNGDSSPRLRRTVLSALSQTAHLKTRPCCLPAEGAYCSPHSLHCSFSVSGTMSATVAMLTEVAKENALPCSIPNGYMQTYVVVANGREVVFI